MGIKQKELSSVKICCLDDESGLYHRDHFHSVLGQELARLDRWGRPLSLIIFDVPALDQAAWGLLSRLIVASLRRIDLAARLDRTKVAVIMPDADRDRAGRWLADFLPRLSAEIPLSSPAVRYGCALALPWERQLGHDLLERALENMKEGKAESAPAIDFSAQTSATAIAADERSLLFDGFKSLGAVGN